MRVKAGRARLCCHWKAGKLLTCLQVMRDFSNVERLCSLRIRNGFVELNSCKQRIESAYAAGMCGGSTPKQAAETISSQLTKCAPEVHSADVALVFVWFCPQQPSIDNNAAMLNLTVFVCQQKAVSIKDGCVA